MQKEAKKLNRKEKNENENGMSQWKISGQLSYIYICIDSKIANLNFLLKKRLKKQ